MRLRKAPAEVKRQSLRKGLESGKLLRLPGAFSPLVAMLIESLGFEGVYVSGAVLSNDLGLPDIGLTTISEVASRGRTIARATNVPSLIDCDTGFGHELNMARTVVEMEDSGLSGLHIEDQTPAKRCGHLENKSLISVEAMVAKIQAATKVRRDPNFLIMARTDARTGEGLSKAIERAQIYADSGADAIFPEALQNRSEFEAFRRAVSVPLLANMTEFGKSQLLTVQELERIGFNMVIYPVTALRLAMKAVEQGLKSIDASGSQKGILDQMQTRQELYALLEYDQLDESMKIE